MPDEEQCYQVRVSDAALDCMLMAATEAYMLGDERQYGQYVEIDGYVWGFHVDRGDETLIQVERFAPAISSKRASDSVEPNEDAALVMDAVMAQLCPQLSFLGEVHTHPYESLRQAQAAHGWRFSDEDLMSMSDTVWQLTRDRPPLWLVVAIAPIEKVRATLPEEIKDDSAAWRFDVGNMRFWLNAEVVVDLDEDGRVQFAETTLLNMVPRPFNFSGNQLGKRPHEMGL